MRDPKEMTVTELVRELGARAKAFQELRDLLRNELQGLRDAERIAGEEREELGNGGTAGGENDATY